MSNRIVKFRAFGVWESDRELKWLEEMASRGFRLVDVCLVIYFFERAEPESVHFCHGFGRVKFDDWDEYLQLYSDAGWQYVTGTIGWHYFRSSVATYSDTDRATVIQGNAKVLKYFCLLLFGGLIINLFLIVPSLIKGDSSIFQAVLRIGVTFVFPYWVLSNARKLQLRNLEKIQRNHKEE